MKISIRNLGLGAALAACALTASAPAMARDGYRDDGDTAAIAIGAGVIGLALGAALADRDDRYYYDRGYYDRRHYVTVRGRPGYYYYYAGSPNRYYRDRYYDRYYAPYYRERWSRGPGWHHDRRDYYRHDGHWGRDRGHDRGRDWRHDRGHDRGRDWGRDWGHDRGHGRHR